MIINSITSLCPLDGRYYEKLNPLRNYLSEYGLIYFRLKVEIEWLIALAEHPQITEIESFSADAKQFLREILSQFNEGEAQEIKNIESITNHDVKAVEYYLKQKMQCQTECQATIEFVHFACTSEDINNLAYALMLKNACHDVILPQMFDTITQLKEMASKYANQPMLSRTHGQPASPTTVGKEFAVFAYRLFRQYTAIKQADYYGKLNGAVGNFNAHALVYPEINWLAISQNFVESLGLQWNPYTTQIESHDYMVEIFNHVQLYNQIVVDLARDVWSYISFGYFKQQLKSGEIGSSTMPHKVNPIDFENAEGNLGMANAVLQHLSKQLPTSRLQRDLVDSTTLRNISIGLGYGFLAYLSCSKGLAKLELNETVINNDLMQAHEILAEAIQTVMRRYGIEQPYEKLKQLTRGKAITSEILIDFIKNLELPERIKSQLVNLKPCDYIGLAAELADRVPIPH